MMGNAVARALDVPTENLHLKERRAGKQDGERYRRIDHTNKKIVVSERDLKFYVNPWDYVDTGLFSDHRNTRQMVREMAAGKDVLNLFCYTAAFSCYAARGGARSTLSVDRSKTAIQWARANLALNAISKENNTLLQAQAFDFLEKAGRRGLTYHLAVVDPPSFSTTRAEKDEFNIVRDHPMLLAAVLRVMKKDGMILFSTNHQDFELQTTGLEFSEVDEITHLTIPEDYVRKRTPIHRCWKMTK
jgi:23S rRNA (cytosine1962-C5)-methyltransferase